MANGLEREQAQIKAVARVVSEAQRDTLNLLDYLNGKNPRGGVPNRASILAFLEAIEANLERAKKEANKL